eukprot:jgi/Phyca11/119644/e_gw1.39.275.1
MFDGWSSGTRHFVAVFVVYHGSDGLCERLVGLAPMKDGQSADAHIEFIDAILDVYGKTLAMVKFVVADNCATNKSVATKLDVPLIGCASHRFNLAMVRFLSNHEHLINMIQRLMTSLRQPNNAAQLALHTALLPEKANATRWSSVWKMVHKYVCIRDAAKHVAEVEELLPRLSEHRRIRVLHDKLKELQSVSEKLQHHSRTLGEVRALFDACMTKYPVMEEYLKPTAEIVHPPVFEAASRAVDYIPLLSVIPPTSNRCERLFSECKYVLEPHRASMRSANFERLMFLKANRDLWNASTLAP